MCGILGWVSSREIDEKVFRQALDLLRYRGPDDSGVYGTPDRKLAPRYKSWGGVVSRTEIGEESEQKEVDD